MGVDSPAPAAGTEQQRQWRDMRFLLGGAFFGNVFLERAIWVIYLTERGYSLLTIGLLQGVLTIAILLFEIPTGLVADRFGKRRAVIAGRAMCALYALSFLGADTRPVMFLGFFVYGIGLSLISGAEQALIFESTDEVKSNHSRAMGRYMALLTFAPAVAAAAGGATQKASWGAVFVGTSLFQIVAGVMGARVSNDTHREVAPSIRPRHLLELFALRGQLMRLTLGLALFGGFVSAYYLVAQSLLRSHDFDIAAIAVLFALAEGLETFSAIHAHRVEKRLGTYGALIVAVVIVGILFLLSGTGNVGFVLLCFLGVALLDNVIDPIGQTLLAGLSASGHRAAVLSVRSLTSSLLIAIFLLLMGLVSQWVDLNLLVGVGGGVAMATTYCLLRASARSGTRPDPGAAPATAPLGNEGAIPSPTSLTPAAPAETPS